MILGVGLGDGAIEALHGFVTGQQACKYFVGQQDARRLSKTSANKKTVKDNILNDSVLLIACVQTSPIPLLHAEKKQRNRRRLHAGYTTCNIPRIEMTESLLMVTSKGAT